MNTIIITIVTTVTITVLNVERSLENHLRREQDYRKSRGVLRVYVTKSEALLLPRAYQSSERTWSVLVSWKERWGYNVRIFHYPHTTTTNISTQVPLIKVHVSTVPFILIFI